MPPQVGKAGDTPQTVITQQPREVAQSKTGDLKAKPPVSDRSQEDPQVTAKTVQSFRQGSAELETQKKAQAQLVQKNLQKQIPLNKNASATTDASGLKNGESISAKATTQQDGFHFEFNRPITKEQAAAIIFQNGKVPDGANLVQGTGNSWIVKVPNDIDARTNTTRHYNAHTETITTPPRKPSDVFFPDSELTFTWTGGALKSSGAQRRDLKNDYGFTINNQFRLDEGQRSTQTLGLSGIGYEFGFDKPMTKNQVMEKLFDKEKINQGGEVRLIPLTPEPTKQWKVEAIGLDAVTAFKRNAQHAITDANVFGKSSLPSNTPAGVRAHIENKTVPNNAVKHEPDVYVWEQDGYMMYVKTNNKGKDGYYEPEMTKMPTDNQGQIWMRYYMQDQGKPPREAWQEFWKDTVEEVRMKLGMINSAARMPQPVRVAPPKSSFGEPPRTSSRIPRTSVPKQSKMNTETTEPPPTTGAKPNEAPTASVKTGKSSGTHHTAEEVIAHEKDLVKGQKSAQAKEAKNINRMARPVQEIDKEIKEVQDELKDLKDIAADHVHGGRPSKTGRDLPIADLKERLRGQAAAGDETAARILRDIEDLQKRLQDLHREKGLLK